MHTTSWVLAIVLVAPAAWAQMVSTGTTDGNTGVSIGVGGGGVQPSKAEREAKAERCRSLLAEGRDCLDKGLYARALNLARQAGAAAGCSGQASEVRKLAVDINKAGVEKLNDADTLYRDGKFAEAIDAFETIFNSFGASPVSRVARRRLQMMEKDPEVRTVLQTTRAARVEKALAKLLDEKAPISASEAEAVPDESGEQEASLTVLPAAEQEAPARAPTTQPADRSRVARILRLASADQLKALSLLQQITRVFPYAEQAAAARVDVKKLEADPAFARRIAEARQAEARRGALNKAEMYFHGGGVEQSLPLYQAVVRDYPDTAEAKSAQARIAEIQAMPKKKDKKATDR